MRLWGSRKIKDCSKKLSKNDDETVRALVKLGFIREEVNEVLSQLPPSKIEERIRGAIKLLSKVSE